MHRRHERMDLHGRNWSTSGPILTSADQGEDGARGAPDRIECLHLAVALALAVFALNFAPPQYRERISFAGGNVPARVGFFVFARGNATRHNTRQQPTQHRTRAID